MRRLILVAGLAGCSTLVPPLDGSTSVELTTDAQLTSGSTSLAGTSGIPTTTDPSLTSGVDSSGGTTEVSTGTSSAPELCGADVAPGPTIVVTSSGALEGAALPGLVAFLGVPYAEPPVGDLRFRPPVPRACAPGLVPAQELGPRCPQIEKNQQGDVTAVLGAEDCLTLNVWTPAADAQARPVLVYIHGGGNSVGGSADELYDGAALAAAQDLVVVTLNYRLGALGFLVHPSLAAEQGGASGNYAIRDQILALQWVQSNIALFGGDPERVAVVGESAGAVNTCALVGSPLAAGLFRGAIVHSGTCSQRTLAALTADIAAPWTASTQCEGAPDVPACLRALDVADLVQFAPDGYPSVSGIGQAWGPHVDGVVLPQSTLDAMAAGDHNQGPLIIGANAGETVADTPPLTVPQYEALVAASFGPIAAMVLAQYPAADYGNDGSAAWAALTGDLKFVCQARRAARAADQGQDPPVYRYHFAYDAYNALPQVKKAAFHGLELVYLFANWHAVLDGMIEYQPNPDDLAMSAQIQGAWARFIATGDPAGMDLPWPAYVAAQDNAALLDVPPGQLTGVRTEQCDFWDSLLP